MESGWVSVIVESSMAIICIYSITTIITSRKICPCFTKNTIRPEIFDVFNLIYRFNNNITSTFPCTVNIISACIALRQTECHIQVSRAQQDQYFGCFTVITVNDH